AARAPTQRGGSCCGRGVESKRPPAAANVNPTTAGGSGTLPPGMPGPAYTRLDVDERRRRLLELGADLFTRFAYDELSMAKIAREAGISKALLYHYFPSKEAYFVATLEKAAAELEERTRPDESVGPLEQLSGSREAFTTWGEAYDA